MGKSMLRLGLQGVEEWGEQRAATRYLYLMGSCFRMSSRLEMAYRPISSVTSNTSVVVLPTALIAENTCIADINLGDIS